MSVLPHVHRRAKADDRVSDTEPCTTQVDFLKTVVLKLKKNHHVNKSNHEQPFVVDVHDAKSRFPTHVPVPQQTVRVSHANHGKERQSHCQTNPVLVRLGQKDLSKKD